MTLSISYKVAVTVHYYLKYALYNIILPVLYICVFIIVKYVRLESSKFT